LLLLFLQRFTFLALLSVSPVLALLAVFGWLYFAKESAEDSLQGADNDKLLS